MAFKKVRRPIRKLLLYPLMDMFFILLLFFLVVMTVGFDKGVEPKKEKYIYSTPLKEFGKAQILLQILNSQADLLWLDYSCALKTIESNKLNLNELSRKLQEFIEVRNKIPCVRKEIHLVIRCPSNLQYSDVLKLYDEIFKKTNSMGTRIDVSLLEGSIEDITQGFIQPDPINKNDIRIEFKKNE